jgi:hypothetical protein
MPDRRARTRRAPRRQGRRDPLPPAAAGASGGRASHWTSYISVEDADATAARARSSAARRSSARRSRCSTLAAPAEGVASRVRGAAVSGRVGGGLAGDDPGGGRACSGRASGRARRGHLVRRRGGGGRTLTMRPPPRLLAAARGCCGQSTGRRPASARSPAWHASRVGCRGVAAGWSRAIARR